jgi:FMN phosphatase YigB (HAD superfamily)
MIGDDLDEDYRSARAAGLHALLLKRERTEADYVRRETEDGELRSVETITSMLDLPSWIERHNNR